MKNFNVRSFQRLGLLTVAGVSWTLLTGATAPVPLYRDPMTEGPTDPGLVYDRQTNQWVMFYTQRRATLPNLPEGDTTWMHDTKIGVARAGKDGVDWRYAGTAKLPEECAGPTNWAPEVAWYAGQYHMWLTVVPGVYPDWRDKPRNIVHLTSPNLSDWSCAGTVDLHSDKVIDADVLQLADGRYRMWYKDERKDSHVLYADSTDLQNWTVKGTAIDTPGEGPSAFFWKGKYWLIEDAWKGFLVMRSDDAEHWTRLGYILSGPGTRRTDTSLGHHGEVVVAGGRAFLFYFSHQENEPEAKEQRDWGKRSAIQVVELHEQNGQLTLDRNAPVDLNLISPPPK